MKDAGTVTVYEVVSVVSQASRLGGTVAAYDPEKVTRWTTSLPNGSPVVTAMLRSR